MAIFQKSVINKHLTSLDKEQVETAYLKFKENYSTAKIEKIKQLKEEEYQDGFLRDVFVDVFGYTLKPDDNHNLVREFKNQDDGRKADGAILNPDTKSGEKAIAVIELKSTKTKDLKSITDQAFNYKNNQPDCKYVITSNFQKLRFYIDYTNEFEEFDLFNLQKDDFELLYLILNTDSIFSDLPLKLKEETKFHEQEVSDKLYKDYSNFKRKLFDNLTKNQTESNKLVLFKKSQKLLDRFLFILFAEDSGLLPPNSISRIIKRYEILKNEDAYKPIYDIFKQYFGYMNIGRKGQTEADNIPAYNGGLFYPDELLDKLKIDDEILIDELLNLSEYDFNTEVDVNILGHIFEHSLSEIEEITAEIEGVITDKTKSKRKKDGVFYTPKYITQYIVENTIGKLCNGKRKELEIEEIEFDGTYRTKDGNLSAKGKKLYQKLKDYKDWLLSLKIVDPACGSGAFLNQALNYLIQEHNNIDDIIAELTNTALRLFDTDKAILENNLYGVDINEESIEIAKLSLWLRTAQKGRKLSVLSNNIKCGNSLIDDPEVAEGNAFNWNVEFSDIMQNGGFDVVIGNPPYVRADSPGNLLSFREHMVSCGKYHTLKGKWDLYIPFLELSIQILSNNGVSSLIIPDAYCHAEYATRSISYFTDNKMLERIDYYPNIDVFANVGVKSVIVTYVKNKVKSYFKTRTHYNDFTFSEKIFKDYPISFRLDYSKSIISKVVDGININDILYISKGIVGNSDEKKYKGEFKVGDLLSNVMDETHPKLYYEGKNIDKWYLNQKRWIEFGTERSPQKWSRKGFSELFTSEKIVAMRSPGKDPRAFIDREQGLFNESAIGFVKWSDLRGIKNKSLSKSYESDDERHKFERISSNLKIQYLLAIMNSKLIKYELNADRRSNIHIYPDDWRKIQIVPLSLEKQSPFVKCASAMGDHISTLQNKQSKFTNYLQSQFSIETFSKKLQNWHELDFGGFIKELNKAISKAGGEKLTKSDEMEWMEVFETKKAEVQILKVEIEKTDKEIDQMVYELYELTEEEIKIVEQNN